MKIIKKIDNSMPMQSFNDSIKSLPCYGVSVHAKYNAEGEFIIKGINGSAFAREIVPNSLALNINIYSEKRLKEVDYNNISLALSELNGSSLIILSSSQLSRYNLNKFREGITENQELELPKIIVASNDDMSYKQLEDGDMMYSSKLKSKSDYEFERLASYIDAEVPVLLDWQDNNNQRISRMIEQTNASDNLIILTKKPKTTRRLFDKTLV